MAPNAKPYYYEATYDDFGIPQIAVALWEQPVTDEDRIYFWLSPEAEVVIYDPETTKAIQRKHPGVNDLWVHARRWGDIQKLLKEDSSVSLAELQKKRFRIGITKEVWEISQTRMLIGIVQSIREKNHRRNLQIEELKRKLAVTM